MPIITKNYDLTAFSDGDFYSARKDRHRFLIIDNHLAALSDIVGDGIISGWNVSDVSTSLEHVVMVSPGMGLIDRTVTRTFGNLRISIQDNSIVYLYMQKKFNYLGGFSAFSEVSSLVAIDNFPPPDPTQLSSILVTYDSISLTWDNFSTLEPDFDHYAIYRSIDGFTTQTLIGTSATNTYIDDNVLENISYSYRVTAFDQSSNESGISNTISVTTLLNTTPPLDPYYSMIFPGDGYIDVIWKASESGITDRYEIWIQELNDEYNAVGSVVIENGDAEKLEKKISDLNNNVFYEITVYAISHNNIYSSGSKNIEAPKFNLGPLSVDSLILSCKKSGTNQFGITLDIEWIPGSDPYIMPFMAERHVITLIENGEIVSDPIFVYDENNISLDIFSVKNSYNPILPIMDYIVKIEAEDKDGRKSNAIVSRIVTSNYNSIAPVTNLTVTQEDDQDLFFIWRNSSSTFLNNILTLTRMDLSSGLVTTIEDSIDYGKKISYTVLSDDLINQSKYTVSLYAIDTFGNKSSISTVSYTLDIDTTIDITAPRNVEVVQGNFGIVVTWDKVNNHLVRYYKIWRTRFKETGTIASDFILIDTISSDLNSYEDMFVSNGQRYDYFVTTVDLYGRESLNPIDDEFYYYPVAFGYFHSDTTFSIVEDIITTPDGFDVIVSWAESIDDFDGYEIYRASGDLSEWEKVGSAGKEFNVFIDEDALLTDGCTYYYMVRKFRNEGKLFVISSDNQPIHSLLLARISIVSGQLNIDSSVATRINNIANTINDFIDEKLPKHKHTLHTEHDSRIDLSRNVIVTDWTTVNDRVFTTTEDISGATEYIAFMAVQGDLSVESLDQSVVLSNLGIETSLGQLDSNGDISNEDSRISVANFGQTLVPLTNIAYEVDDIKKTITFSQSLLTDILYVLCVGLTETKGILQSSKMGDLSATLAESGKVDKEQLKDVSHPGRLSEELIPLQVPMSSSDGYKFDIEQNLLGNSEIIGEALSFYDFRNSYLIWDDLNFEDWNTFSYTDWDNFYYLFSDIDDNDLLSIAATSSGLMSRKNSVWDVTMQTDSSPRELFYNAAIDECFAITGSSVYVSKNQINWVRCLGLDKVHSIKDLDWDTDGNTFVSTDKGVYILKAENVFANYLYWEQTSLIDASTSNTFAIWNDHINSRIVVSGELGLLSSVDLGDTWVYTNEIDTDEIIIDFYVKEEYIYALTDSSIWRKKSLEDSFEKIAQLNIDLAQTIIVYDNTVDKRLMVSTTSGLFVSNVSFDIFTDVDIEFDVGLPVMNFTSKVITITCLHYNNGRIAIGTESKLFEATSFTDLSLTYDDKKTIPSVYIDSELQHVGYTYYTVDNSVTFDNIISCDSVVSVANQYVLFKPLYEGWADQRYDSNLTLYKNGKILSEMAGEIIGMQTSMLSSVGSVEFEDFTEDISNSERANEFVAQYNAELQLTRNDAIAGSTDIQLHITDLVDLYNKVYSQLLGRVRFATSIMIDNDSYIVFNKQKIPFELDSQMLSDYEIVSTLPAVSIADSKGAVTIDVVSGICTFANALNKYDYLTIDILNSVLEGRFDYTHREIDDELESINSGLSYSLGEVHQSNILKTGLFLERKFPDGRSITDVSGTPIYSLWQSTINIPISDTWYDTLNSTVGYLEELSLGSVEFSVDYVTSVYYSQETNRVLVGSRDGVMLVSTTDITFSILDFNKGEKEYVRDIKSFDGVLYILTDYNLYESTDYGNTWIRNNELSGISGKFLYLSKKGVSLLISTDNGVYYRDNTNNIWSQSLVVSNITSLYSGDFVSLISEGNKVYYSTKGFVWEFAGKLNDVHVNDMVLYRGLLVLPTDLGLRLDNSTFYTPAAATSLVDLTNNLELSESLMFNSVALHPTRDEHVSGVDDGRYYIYNGNSYTEYNSGLKSVHKLVYVGDDIWLFGHDMLKVPSMDNPIKLSMSVPF